MHFSSILAVWITIQLTIKIGQPTTKVEEPLKIPTYLMNSEKFVPRHLTHNIHISVETWVSPGPDTALMYIRGLFFDTVVL